MRAPEQSPPPGGMVKLYSPSGADSTSGAEDVPLGALSDENPDVGLVQCIHPLPAPTEEKRRQPFGSSCAQVPRRAGGRDMVTSPLVAFLLSPERLLELEWLWLDTPGLLTVLSTCRALRAEHQWRADAICQDEEWWWFHEMEAAEEEELRREVASYLRSPTPPSTGSGG